MEATETINQNGDIERTVVLNPEESSIVLGQMSPGILDQINQTVTAITPEDLERILDEAAGITPITQEQTNTENTMDNMFPSNSLSSNFEYTNESENTNEEQNEEDLNEVSETTENTTEEAEETPIVYNTNLNLGPSITTSRFNGAEWFDYIRTRDVIIGGIGGIGSWLSLLLSRTDVGKITLYDDDIVEEANLSGQFFSISNIKDYKVCAVTDNLRDFSNYYRINYQIFRYEARSSAAPIMMCGFDNMEARKVFFNNWKRNLLNEDKSKCLLIDGRL